MSNSITDEFSLLSPSQKRELERKRKEKEAREAENAAKRAEAARKAREAAKRAEEERIATIKAQNAAHEAEIQQKKTLLYCGIVTLCVLVVLVIWLWIHLFGVSYKAWFGGGEEIEPKVVYGIFYFGISLFLVAPIIAVLQSGIAKMAEKIKELK